MDMTTRRQLACKVVNLDILAAASESDPANAPQEQEKSVQRDKLMREVEILKMLNHVCEASTWSKAATNNYSQTL